MKPKRKYGTAQAVLAFIKVAEKQLESSPKLRAQVMGLPR